MSHINLLDVVTLRQSVQAFSQETGETVTLPAGQVGTVVEVFTPEDVMVEFDREDGEALALVSVRASQLEHRRSECLECARDGHQYGDDLSTESKLSRPGRSY